MTRNPTAAPSQRQLRVGEEIRHALAEIFAREALHDPALHDVSLTFSEVRISPDLVMLPDQIDQIRRLIESMPDGFTIADFRDRTGLSRKYAVPILEWADTEKLTVRRGDTRRVR